VTDWHRFVPSDFEYDFEKDKLAAEVKLSQEEIDERVIAEIDDPSAWEEPIEVRRDVPAKLSISAELAVRAEFLAKLHHEANVERWLTRIIRERVELEELLSGQRPTAFCRDRPGSAGRGTQGVLAEAGDLRRDAEIAG
jgi:hypothetical protein